MTWQRTVGLSLIATNLSATVANVYVAATRDQLFSFAAAAIGIVGLSLAIFGTIARWYE